MNYEPKMFARGEDRRMAYSKSQEVALQFDGYKAVDGDTSISETHGAATPAPTQEHEGTPQYDANGFAIENEGVPDHYQATSPSDL